MNQLNPQNFFDNTGGGSGAPSGKLKDLNDMVFGVIVDQYMAPATDFSTKKQKVDRDGAPIEQLVVVLDTPQRNWQGVSKIPTVDKDNPQSPQKDPNEDDGRRAVYVEPWTNIHAAVGNAVITANGAAGPLLNGAKFGVKIIELRDTGKGNPLKIHQAFYEAPAQATPQGDFFSGGQQAQPQAAPPAAPPQQVAQPQVQQAAPPAQDPWSGGQAPSANPWDNQAAAQQQAAPPAQSTPAGNPWGAQEGPPF